MPLEPFPHYRAGDMPSAAALNRLQQAVSEQDHVTGDSGIGVRRTAGGVQLYPTEIAPFWGQITSGTNGAATSLDGSFLATDTVLTVHSLQGFPDQTPFFITINRAEVCQVIAMNGLDLTVTRGAGGTTAIDYPATTPTGIPNTFPVTTWAPLGFFAVRQNPPDDDSLTPTLALKQWEFGPSGSAAFPVQSPAWEMNGRAVPNGQNVLLSTADGGINYLFDLGYAPDPVRPIGLTVAEPPVSPDPEAAPNGPVTCVPSEPDLWSAMNATAPTPATGIPTWAYPGRL